LINKKKQTTIHDVAEKAGVSIKTVSRVINKETNVRKATISKVQSVIQDLNYQPNVFAQSLAGGKTRIIGLIYDNPNPVYISHIMDGVLSYCYQMEYAVIIHPCKFEDRDLLSVMSELIKKTRLTGMILTPPLSDSKELLTMLDTMEIPNVLISPGSEDINSNCVTTNDYESSKKMTQHMIKNGHRKIAFVKGHPDHLAVNNRAKGYIDALEESGIGTNNELIIQGYNSYESGIECGKKLLELKERPTAIFAANDEMAGGIIKVITEAGMSIPEDFSVAGFDDTPITQMLNPPLSTIRQPLEKMGEIAAKKLIAQLEGITVSNEQSLESTLVLRESINTI
jgi:LacI family transcriptional regulator